MALINILDNVKKYLDEKENVGIYLDLTKAFDTVQHIPSYLTSSIIMVFGEWQTNGLIAICQVESNM